MNTKDYCWKVSMPYCLKPLGKNHYAILNRYYRPLGYLNDFFLPDDEYQSLLRKNPIHIPYSKKLQNLHWGDKRDDGCIYLHKGSLIEEKDWVAYLKKLRLLAGLIIEL